MPSTPINYVQNITRINCLFSNTMYFECAEGCEGIITENEWFSLVSWWIFISILYNEANYNIFRII